MGDVAPSRPPDAGGTDPSPDGVRPGRFPGCPGTPVPGHAGRSSAHFRNGSRADGPGPPGRGLVGGRTHRGAARNGAGFAGRRRDVPTGRRSRGTRPVDRPDRGWFRAVRRRADPVAATELDRLAPGCLRAAPGDQRRGRRLRDPRPDRRRPVPAAGPGGSVDRLLDLVPVPAAADAGAPGAVPHRPGAFALLAVARAALAGRDRGGRAGRRYRPGRAG
jgi:hypothetical protein